jgi:RimJ/RimL family protein N-acetyltransferase
MLMHSQNLQFEPLTAAHADDLFPILTTPAVLAFIDPTTEPPTLEELRAEYAACARGPVDLIMPSEQWFNMAIQLKSECLRTIGRLEATCYREEKLDFTWGEVAYLLGEAWWGKGLAFEAVSWWHDYLESIAPGTQWWATVHPQNQRSIRLLTRLNYREVDASQRPQLQSYDFGDRCFVHSA